MNGNPKGLCIKMNMTLVELKKHIYNTLHVSGDININIEYMGIHIVISLTDYKDVEYFIN